MDQDRQAQHIPNTTTTGLFFYFCDMVLVLESHQKMLWTHEETQKGRIIYEKPTANGSGVS